MLGVNSLKRSNVVLENWSISNFFFKVSNRNSGFAKCCNGFSLRIFSIILSLIYKLDSELNYHYESALQQKQARLLRNHSHPNIFLKSNIPNLS